MGTATAAAQLVPMIATPWLTRIYGPAAFGIFGIFLAVVMTFSRVALGRYEMGVPVADDDDQAACLLVGSLVVLMGFSVFALMLVGATLILLDISCPMWLVWAGLSFILCAGVQQSLSSWFTRNAQFRALAVVRIIRTVMAAVASVTFGWYTGEAWGLVMGAVGGQAAGALTAIPLAVPGVSASWNRRTAGAIRRALWKNLEFPRVNAPHALLDGLRVSGFVAVFAAVFGVVTNGLYGVGVRVLRLPTALVGSAIGQVLFSRFSRDRRSGHDMRGLLFGIMGLLAFVSIPIFGLIVVYGPELFAFTFGPEWREAGQFARIMAPALWISFAIAPAATLPIVVGRMRGAFGFAMADLAMRTGSLAAGFATSSATVTLVCMSIGGVLLSIATGAWYLKIATQQDRTLVVFLGSGWTQTLSDEMGRHFASDRSTAYAALPLNRPISTVLSWHKIEMLLRADILVRVGFRPASQTARGRLFEIGWGLLRRANPGADAVMYWIGSDVLRSREMLNRGLNQKKFERLVSSTSHWAGSDNLCQELTSIGVRARVVWFPALTLPAPNPIPPFPDDFTVLSYVPDPKADFYGGPSLIEVANFFPSIKFRIVGGYGSWAPEAPRNVEFLGWVDDMASEYCRSTVVVRLVEHDALGATAIEGLMYGRFVVYSGDLRYAVKVAKGNINYLIETVGSMHSQWRCGNAGPDFSAARWAADQFNQPRRLAALRVALTASGLKAE